MAKQVMLGVRLDAETRAAFKAWCAARQVTAQAVLRDDVAKHLASPAVPPIPRDRAMVQVLRPRPWPKRLWGRLSTWTTGRKRRTCRRECSIIQRYEPVLPSQSHSR